MTKQIARLAGAFILASVALGAPTRAQTTSTASADGARLAGRVIDAADGKQPVRRAIVTIAGSAAPTGRSAVSDDEGRFGFQSLPAGEYTLSATRPGFLRATYGALRPGRPGTPITIRAGGTLDVTLTMTHGSAVEGVLRDIAGDPAPGMRVEAIRVQRRPAGDRGETMGTALTDDRGGYRLFGLPPGDYVLAATPAMIVGGIGEIGAPSEAEMDARLAALRRNPGAPAPPVSPGAQAPAPAAPVQKGYAMPATYYPGVLQSGEAMRITLGANDERVGLDFAMRLSRAAAIDGVVVPMRGQAAPQVQIGIQGAAIDLPVAGGGGAGGPSLSMRPAEHTFHYANVPPGKYRITARTFGAPGSQGTVISSGGLQPPPDPSAGVQWAVADVEVGNDDLTGVTLALRPAPQVTGRVVFDATELRPPADAAIVRIALEPVADVESGSNGLTGPITVNARRDGTFEFPAVIPGAYRVTAAVAGGWWLRSAIVSAKDVLDGLLTVGANGVAGATLTFSDRHSAIAGTLFTAANRPAPDYYMAVFSADRTLWRAPSRRVRSTRPATNGGFEFRDLPPGAYYLAALTDVEAADLEDGSFLESLIPSAVPLTIGEGERKIQDVRINGG